MARVKGGFTTRRRRKKVLKISQKDILDQNIHYIKLLMNKLCIH